MINGMFYKLSASYSTKKMFVFIEFCAFAVAQRLKGQPVETIIPGVYIAK